MTLTTNILIADDHRVVRDGFKEILRNSDQSFIAHEAADGKEALKLAMANNLDLIVLDVSMPGINGIEVLKQLREMGVSTPILFFSMHPPEQYEPFVLRNDAQGFIGKDADVAEIIYAIKQVLSGNTYFSENVSPAKRTADGSPLNELSPREKEVLVGLLHGHTQIEIAKQLGITNKSVGTYRGRILQKFGVQNNAELIALTTRLGL